MNRARTTDDVVFPFAWGRGWRVAVAGDVLQGSHASHAEAAAAGRIVARQRLARALVVIVGGRMHREHDARTWATSIPMAPRVTW